jgi:hypothetical protein
VSRFVLDQGDRVSLPSVCQLRQQITRIFQVWKGLPNADNGGDLGDPAGAIFIVCPPELPVDTPLGESIEGFAVLSDGGVPVEALSDLRGRLTDCRIVPLLDDDFRLCDGMRQKYQRQNQEGGCRTQGDESKLSAHSHGTMATA